MKDIQKIDFAERDAQAMYDVLITKQGGGFPAKNVKLLLGSEATFTAVHDAISVWLPSVAKDEDRVLIYFAGHGKLSDQSNEGYLAPYDVKPTQIDERTISMTWLAQIFDKSIHSRWKALFIDACHSGATIDSIADEIANLFGSSGVRTFGLSKKVRIHASIAILGGGHGVFHLFP